MNRLALAAAAAALAIAPAAAPTYAPAPTEKAIPAGRQPKIHKRGNVLTGKGGRAKHKGEREKACRRAQIAAGRLKAANGLVI